MSDAVSDHDPSPDPARLTERQRAVRGILLGATLGAVLATLARRRRGRPKG
jgi:hypothetical protein